MRAHTTTDEPRAAPGARTKRTILALSLAVALLGATASTVSADGYASGTHNRVGAHGVLSAWNCPPLSPAQSWPFAPQTEAKRCFSRGVRFLSEGLFNFGYHRLGTSASQRFALGAIHETFSPTVRVSGDYAQTNNCPPTLSAPEGQVQGCIIDVTFTPTRKGTRRGTLTTGPGGPTVALTGTTETPHPQLSGKRKQSLGQDVPTHACIENGRCTTGVRVGLSCGHVVCIARATGRLTRVKKDRLKQSDVNSGPAGSAHVEPGQTKATLWLELTSKQRKQASKALADGEKVKAKVTVPVRAVARDDGTGHAAGKVKTAKRTIKLVK